MQGGRILKFPGFSAEALKFLAGLKRHNNRDWFQKNKQVYEDQLVRPMEALISALAVEFEDFAPDVVATPKSCLYRIYRDTRFSKDKSPYKTHVAAVFPIKGLGKHEGAGFYFHFDAKELLIGGGLYMPMPEELMAVRTHIASHHGRLESVLKAKRFRTVYGEIQGEQVTRVPRGFPPEHPAAIHLRRKQWLASTTTDAKAVLSSRFQDKLVASYKALYPLVQFLNEPIIRNRKQRERQEAMLATSSMRG